MPYLVRADVFRAEMRWLEVDEKLDNFEKFMATPAGLLPVGSFQPTYLLHVTKHTCERLNMLLSPHYRVIIKAWLAKQEK